MQILPRPDCLQLALRTPDQDDIASLQADVVDLLFAYMQVVAFDGNDIDVSDHWPDSVLLSFLPRIEDCGEMISSTTIGASFWAPRSRPFSEEGSSTPSLWSIVTRSLSEAFTRRMSPARHVYPPRPG